MVGNALPNDPTADDVNLREGDSKLWLNQSNFSVTRGDGGAGQSPQWMLWENGTIFEGAVVSGAPEGQGICAYASGCFCIGNFTRGYVEGPAEVLLPSRAFFVGNFCLSAANGHGVLYHNGKLIRGEWHNGMLLLNTMEIVDNARSVKFYNGVVDRLYQQAEKLKNKKTFPSSSFQYVERNSSLLMREPVVLLGDKQEMSDKNLLEGGKGTTNIPLNLPADGPTTQAPYGLTGQSGAPRGEPAGHSFVTQCRQPNAFEAEQQTSFARSVLASGASQDAIFACAAPAANEFLSSWRYAQCFLILLLPFISLLSSYFSPMRRVMLKMEREFVVSGAFLFRSFNVPIWYLSVGTCATFCSVSAIVIVALKVTMGRASEGMMTIEEICIPCALWVFQAAVYAAYNSYVRVAHALERLDRRLTPQLYAFAAGVVNTKAKVCVFTWDDEGRRVVTNRHYRIRWLVMAFFVGVSISLAGPLTRLGYKKPMFGYSTLEKVSTSLMAISVALFSSMITFYVLKLTDMQRQVQEQMCALTRLAYLEGKSVMHPSEHIIQRFNFEESFNVNNIFSGVTGWYVMRSVVIYAATCSNHAARGLAMSIFFMLVILTFVMITVDMVYMAAFYYADIGKEFSCIHTYGILMSSIWGLLLIRYLYKCIKTINERERHLYLLDVASVYHRTKYKNVEGCADVIASCREMVRAHEQVPCIFSFPITPLILTFVVMLFLTATVIAIVRVYVAVKTFYD
uniref:Uncharacterized protein n=1 Tax=Trypanosoma congolense (strain IL3000) TaxID=1068625 RepID=G0UM29_TRYCI|nr:conserved hypothetical protein [Trypanosoma congolense IL3000]